MAINPEAIQQAVQCFYSQAIADFLARMDRAIDADDEFLENWEFEGQALPDLRRFPNRVDVPKAVLDAFDYYATEVMDQDWGVVYGGTLPIELSTYEQLATDLPSDSPAESPPPSRQVTPEQTPQAQTYIIRVMTDGDDGWLEVFDAEGNCLGVGRTNEGRVHWGDRDLLRSQVQSGELPPELSP